MKAVCSRNREEQREEFAVISMRKGAAIVLSLSYRMYQMTETKTPLV